MRARFPPAFGSFDGGREGVCQRAPFSHLRLGSSTGAARASAECPFPACVWLLPRGQGGRLPESALLPPASGLFHEECPFPTCVWILPRGQGGPQSALLPGCLASSTETGRAAFHLRASALPYPTPCPCWLSAGPRRARNAFLRSRTVDRSPLKFIYSTL